MKVQLNIGLHGNQTPPSPKDGMFDVYILVEGMDHSVTIGGSKDRNEAIAQARDTLQNALTQLEAADRDLWLNYKSDKSKPTGS